MHFGDALEQRLQRRHVAEDDDAQTGIDASLAKLCTRVTARLLSGAEGTLCFYCARAPASWRHITECSRCPARISRTIV